MSEYMPILYLSITVILFILYLYEIKQHAGAEEINKRSQNIIKQLDEQAKLIIKTDLALNKVQEELDKKITGLYSLHELGKKINSTLNIEDLFNLINKPFVNKLGFSKALIVFKDEISGSLLVKTSLGYSEAEIKRIELEINKGPAIDTLLKKSGFLLVNRDLKKIKYEDLLSELFHAESFLTVPIAVKNEAAGFILMGNASSYSKATEGDAELLSILANQIGTAIENARLYTELFNSHHKLELRVKERTAELLKLNEELKRHSKIKSDFVSAVSHELRTPLTSIKGYASILKSGKLGEVSPQQQERLEKIDKHSNHLGHLVNDLLDIARIESGRVQMDIKEISLKELMDSIIDIITPQVKEKNISLTVKLDKIDKIKADSGQMERVFLNLVSNAVKFTPENGKITLLAKDNDDNIEFVVEDSGIGIPKEDLDRVFDEFFRSDNAADQKIKGTGLGLSLVKKIVQAHKGRIWVESELEKGTKFSFTIAKD